MKRHYIEKSKMDNFLKEITAAQQKANIFSNVSVKPPETPELHCTICLK